MRSELLSMEVLRQLKERFHKNCLECTHFDEEKDICVIAQKRPPARIIIHGCESFEDNIPF